MQLACMGGGGGVKVSSSVQQYTKAFAILIAKALLQEQVYFK